MKRWLKTGIFLVILAVFVFSAVEIGSKFLAYKKGQKIYEAAAGQFVTVNPQKPLGDTSSDDGPLGGESDGGVSTGGGEDPAGNEADLAPIVVDFASLRAVNEDVVGWIYCEDTLINYPVLRGDDNDEYLHHDYLGNYLTSGSIFMESANSGDFMDSNTIIYGHHMRDGSMFGQLGKWGDQQFLDDHPVFWLLTPERDYRVEIISCYTISAYSDTYTIFRGPSIELDEYLEKMTGRSVVEPPAKPVDDARYVVLSTCVYSFQDARFVVHGMLVPVDSAGGEPIEE